MSERVNMKLNDIPNKARMMSNKSTPMIRIEWRINNTSGYGNWFDIAERSILQSWVSDANKRYGAGTHKIATAAA